MVIRVLIDGQVFSIHKRGGIGRTFSSVFDEYTKLRQDHHSDLKLSLGVFLTKYSDIPRDHKKWWPFQMKGPFTSSKIALVTNWLYLWLKPYKILHSTYYFQRYLIRRPGTKHVVTLHDMIPEDFPHFFLDSIPHFQKENFLRNADRIICVSQYTMSRLEYHYPDLAHKAIVIYPGVTSSAQNNRTSAGDFRILYVGRRGGYKDFATLLRAISPIIESEPRLQVLAVGSDKFSASEAELITELGLVGRVIQKELLDKDLEEAYKTCLAVVVTSHVEGFGLPVIEAMSHGALVIATDIPVFNETAGGNFLSFAPGDIAGLTSVLQSVLADPRAFDVNREKGILIAREYTWKKTLMGLLDLYREIENPRNNL